MTAIQSFPDYKKKGYTREILQWQVATFILSIFAPYGFYNLISWIIKDPFLQGIIGGIGAFSLFGSGWMIIQNLEDYKKMIKEA